MYTKYKFECEWNEGAILEITAFYHSRPQDKTLYYTTVNNH